MKNPLWYSEHKVQLGDSMKKPALLMFGIGVLVLVVIGVVLFGRGQDTMVHQSATSEQPAAEPTLNPLGIDARYQPFTPEYLVQTADTRRVLFFYANWCPTCRPADADFVSNISEIPEDVTVIRVNYDDSDTDDAERALAKQYNVTYQHTYIQIDAEGKPVTTWNCGGVDELLANIQ